MPSDPDGGPLTAAVEYSANGGRTWRGLTISQGSRGRSVVPTEMLTASTNGRFRVRVDDGFSEVVATSGRLVVEGAPPKPRIDEPVKGQRIRADVPLTLRGAAIAAGGTLVRPSALRWFDGRRAIGRGRALTVPALSPGRHVIRLSATAGGRTGTTTRVITVRAVKPEIIRLTAPPVVARTARSIRLTLATNVAATLTLGRARIPLSQRPRTVTIKITPGTGKLRVTLTLRAGGLVNRPAVSIPRL